MLKSIGVTVNSRGPKPRDPSPAAERVTYALTELGDDPTMKDFAEVVIALTWVTEETHRLKDLLLEAGIDPDAKQAG